MVSLSKWGNQDETHSSGRELLDHLLGDGTGSGTMWLRKLAFGRAESDCLR
jgi:hypothetical protein